MAKEYALVQDLLAKYTRPVTVLELGDTHFFGFTLSQKTEGTWVLLAAEHADKVACRVRCDGLTHVMVAGPLNLDIETIVQPLSRCEYPDVVIIHPTQVFSGKTQRLLKAALEVGDYLIIRVPKIDGPMLFMGEQKPLKSIILDDGVVGLFKGTKRGLDIARWTQAKRMPILSDPRYVVESDFDHKVLKKDKSDPTAWTDGINLISAVMLGMVYPTTEMMKQDILRMLPTGHNDLVLGNMVVCHNRLVPIDLNDVRRNADTERCVTAALTVLARERLRMKNPERWMQKYRDCMARLKQA